LAAAGSQAPPVSTVVARQAARSESVGYGPPYHLQMPQDRHERAAPAGRGDRRKIRRLQVGRMPGLHAGAFHPSRDRQAARRVTLRPLPDGMPLCSLSLEGPACSGPARTPQGRRRAGPGRNRGWPHLSRTRLPCGWNLLPLCTSIHFVKERKSRSRIIPARTVRVFRVSGDHRVRSTLFHASGGIAAQIRKDNLKSGTCGGAGAESRRHEIAGGITAATRRGQEPGGAGRRVAPGRQA
jgi:hypothetical protein